MDNTFRLFLVVITFVSFVPQYLRIISRRDSAGISLTYVLLNLISATEQFTLSFHFITENAEAGDTIVNTPPTVGDWLNLAQSTVLLGSHLVLMGLCYYIPPERNVQKRVVLAVYVAFLLVSVAPAVFAATLHRPNQSPEGDDKWFSAIFLGVHTIFINPIITFSSLASMYPQIQETLSRSGPRALSIQGLIVQSIVFLIVGSYWSFRMTIPSEYWDPTSALSWAFWYQVVGWAAVDNIVYSIVQASILAAVLRNRSSTWGVGGNAETTPLLYK